jgi:hypothetical protein
MTLRCAATDVLIARSFVFQDELEITMRSKFTKAREVLDVMRVN